MTEILSLSSQRVKKKRKLSLSRDGNQEKKRGTDNKKEAKKIKSDNFTGNIREKSNIAMAMFEKLSF